MNLPETNTLDVEEFDTDASEQDNCSDDYTSLQEVVAKDKQSVYAFTCGKCGVAVNINTDKSLSVQAKKNLHVCPSK